MTDFSFQNISHLVSDQLPEYVKSDYSTFVAFIEAYYEYLEQEGKLIHTMNNLRNYLDLDYVFAENLTNFISAFESQYLHSIPKDVLVNKALLIRHIKEFYSKKGTEKSFKFLFRILFNEDVDLTTMSKFVLRVSDGKWYQPYVLRINTSNNLSEWIGTQINGTTSYATAIVDDATFNYQNNVPYKELTLSNIQKTFTNNEIIMANTASGNTLYGNISSVLIQIAVIDGGSRYNVGDPIIITGGGGANANAIIGEVLSGRLTDVSVIEGGAGFQINPNYQITVSGSSTPTTLRISGVNKTGEYHPNSYTITNSIFSIYSANAINSFGNVISSQIFSSTEYSNTGPLTFITVIDGGSNYASEPIFTITPTSNIAGTNTIISDYGTIGTFEILDAGLNYQANDIIKIHNHTSIGVGGAGIIKTVNSSGSITSTYVSLPFIEGTVNVSSATNVVIGTGTYFTRDLIANDNPSFTNGGTYITINNESVRISNIANDIQLTTETNFTHTAENVYVYLTGHMKGGYGYTLADFSANGLSCEIISKIGSGGSVKPKTILGSGEILSSIGDVYGKIKRISVTAFGDGYTSEPTIDLSQSGDGLATAEAKIINGVFRYPGRFLNEDGQLSSRRYLQNASKYNDYSYLIKSKVAVNKYYDLVYRILHPIGTNMIGITNICAFTNINNVDISGEIFIVPTTPLLDFSFILDEDILS